MGFSNRYLILPISAALVFGAVGCESAKKPATAVPIKQALAPSLPEPQPVAFEAPKVQEQVSQQLDPIDRLIADVEREYAQGQVNYSAGHLDAAKENFDRAVMLLLESRMDLKSNPRLQDEFDRVVEGVHELEMQALKEGDGFTVRSADPAPIDEASQMTFPVDPNVREKAEAEVKSTVSDLPLVMNDLVAGYINFFSGRGRGTLERSLTRAGKYRAMIEKTFAEEGIPQDLIYLAVAESGFQPAALSHAGARGMWQFMQGTGKLYDLRRTWWIDERQDPVKATRAAARHLKDLYNQFGDWYLAMASYNSGAGNVQYGVEKTGYADFWELYRRNVLPRETKNYVPIILAVAIMAKNPEQYGLTNIVPEPAQEKDEIQVDYPLDLRLAAEAADVSVETLRELNPMLLRMTTPRNSQFTLYLPKGTKERFQTAIAAIPEDKRVLWRYHSVDSGDTLSAIAKKYRVSEAALREVNNLASADDLQAETKLIIPTGKGGSRGYSGDAVAFSRKAQRYTVRRGDTILGLAEEFGVPPEKIRQWNRLRGNDLRAGQRLVIYPPVEASGRRSSAKAELSGNGSQTAHRTHRVQKGDTLYSIAARYGTTIAALKNGNRNLSAQLLPGQLVLIP